MAELWKELHKHALNYVGSDDTEYLRVFSNKIPRYVPGCACREHWRIWIRSNPPKFGNNGEYFEWTVLAHNVVNQRLKKPVLTVEEAKALYI